MKKNILCMITLSFLLSFIPAQLSAATNKVSLDKIEKVESAEAKIMLTRLDEIKSIDKSNMTSSEKKQLRKEVRTLRTNLAQLNGGIYLSAGAIIVILLLLILFL